MKTGQVRQNVQSPTRRTVLRTAGGMVGAGVAAPFIGRLSPALAAYPDRPIKLLVPFGPGGPVDVIARIVGAQLGEALGGASVVVENRAGASGNLGVGLAARADPDGYTVLFTSSTFVINPMLFTNVPYDPIADFTPLVDLASSPTAFAVTPQLGVNTLAEFVALAKKDGSKLSYGSAGFGTPAHLAGEFLKNRAGIDMAHVPFNGAAPATQALLSGAIQFVSFALPGVHPHVKGGTMKGLAVTGEKRWFDLPEVPTMVEVGYPGFVLDTFTAMLLPAKTPPEIADRLSKAVLTVLGPPEIRAKLRTVGFEVNAGGSDALKAKIARELPLWRDIAKIAGIKPTESK